MELLLPCTENLPAENATVTRLPAGRDRVEGAQRSGQQAQDIPASSLPRMARATTISVDSDSTTTPSDVL